MILPNPQSEIDAIVSFVYQTFQVQHKTTAVIAVSGGIDSALSLTLATKALGPANVHTLFLPYGDQSIEDSKAIAEWNKIPKENQHTINIQVSVDQMCQTLEFETWNSEFSNVRKGNIMARTRMICVYDTAKKLDALVCGTENKSEHYLGYFTRFGDAASDIEPICHLYKTQVRQLVEHLNLPEIFLTKAPSAGLWQRQTDETEMGFTYKEADLILEQLIDEKKKQDEIKGDNEKIEQVLRAVETMKFKLEVPYTVVPYRLCIQWRCSLLAQYTP